MKKAQPGCSDPAERAGAGEAPLAQCGRERRDSGGSQTGVLTSAFSSLCSLGQAAALGLLPGSVGT